MRATVPCVCTGARRGTCVTDSVATKRKRRYTDDPTGPMIRVPRRSQKWAGNFICMGLRQLRRAASAKTDQKGEEIMERNSESPLKRGQGNNREGKKKGEANERRENVRLTKNPIGMSFQSGECFFFFFFSFHHLRRLYCISLFLLLLSIPSLVSYAGGT